MPRPTCWTLIPLLAAVGGGALAQTPLPVQMPTRLPASQPAERAAAPVAQDPGSERPRPTLALQVGHSSGIMCLAFSPDGRTLATGSQDTTVRLWDVATGQLKAILQGHTWLVWAVAFSPDGKVLATGGGRGGIREGRPIGAGEARLWDARSGRLLANLDGHEAMVGTLAFSPDGTTLATGSADHTVRLWNARSGELQGTLRGHTGSISFVAFSPVGRVLATASYDGTTRLWSLADRQVLTTLRHHTANVYQVAFAPDGRTLATASEDATAALWDSAGGPPRAVLRGHTGWVTALAFSREGTTLATASGDATARLWDVPSGHLRATLLGHAYGVQNLAFSPDGRLLATGGADQTIRLWDASSGDLRSILQGHRGNVSRLAFSPDSRLLATGGVDATPRLWEVPSGRLRAALQGDRGPIGAYAFSPDGRRLATGSGDGAARLWDRWSGRLLATMRGPAGSTPVAFSPDGRRLATASEDGSLRLWDARSGQLRAKLSAPAGFVGAMAFSPDGKLLAIGGGLPRMLDGRQTMVGETRVWDLERGQIHKAVQGHAALVWLLAFSPDGKTLATGARDGRTRFWDVPSGQPRATLGADPFSVLALAFSPDGKKLATGSFDRTARLWDVETGQLQATLEGHRADLRTVAFSHDGRLLAVTDATGQVTLWDLATTQRAPLTSLAALAGFPPQIACPVSLAGSAIALHDPREGRILATLLPVSAPPVAETASSGASLAGGDTITAIQASTAPAGLTEWFVTTPEGYFDGSANAARFMRWNVDGVLYPAERYQRRFRRPDLIRKALRGEPVAAPGLSVDHVPPSARFVGLKPGDTARGDTLTVTVEARDDRDVAQVELRVNGRPLAPEHARPIVVGAKTLVPEGSSAGSVEESDPHHRSVRRMTFRLPLPLGTPEIHLQATAYDDADLGSDPVEIVLKRPGAKPVPGNLYVLSVGVGRYQNGGQGSGVGGRGINHLRFPAEDARAIAARFQRAGRPLYARVELRTLTDGEATAARVREELKRLRQKVRPGQIDTVVVFLSGHGISRDGRYYFGTHEANLRRVPETMLSGAELGSLLGGSLRAKAVFLFVDTCHAGGLSSRNDDLAIQLADNGVYVLCSSGATEYAYESPMWGHGAFTLALLRTLDAPEADGVVRFNTLAYRVPNEVAALLTAAGRNETEQQPRFRALGPLRAPIVQAAR